VGLEQLRNQLLVTRITHGQSEQEEGDVGIPMSSENRDMYPELRMIDSVGTFSSDHQDHGRYRRCGMTMSLGRRRFFPGMEERS
jgi:hypothetical protein